MLQFVLNNIEHREIVNFRKILKFQKFQHFSILSATEVHFGILSATNTEIKSSQGSPLYFPENQYFLFCLSYEVLCHPSTSAPYCNLLNHLKMNREGVLVPMALHKQIIRSL